MRWRTAKTLSLAFVHGKLIAHSKVLFTVHWLMAKKLVHGKTETAHGKGFLHGKGLEEHGKGDPHGKGFRPGENPRPRPDQVTPL